MVRATGLDIPPVRHGLGGGAFLGFDLSHGRAIQARPRSESLNERRRGRPSDRHQWAGELRERIDRGQSSRDVARALGIDQRTVRDWAKELGLRFGHGRR